MVNLSDKRQAICLKKYQRQALLPPNEHRRVLVLQRHDWPFYLDLRVHQLYAFNLDAHLALHFAAQEFNLHKSNKSVL